MELIFNELSAEPKIDDIESAYNILNTFKDCYYEAAGYGFKGIRFDRTFEEIELVAGLNIRSLRDMRAFRDMTTWLYTVALYPRLHRGSIEEERFAANDFSVTYADGQPKTAYGLGIAYLLKTSAISFSHDPYWQRHTHTVDVAGTENGSHTVLAISLRDHCHSPEFINLADEYAEVDLIEDLTEPAEKRFRVRDDHGTDIVAAKWERLRRSRYVTAALMTLPYDSQARNFIEDVRSGGIIHIRFTDTKQGLGLKIKTTGRTKRETEAIAEILRDEYGE